MTSEQKLKLAQAFVDRKYCARSDARQKSMGLAYVEAERQDLAREIVRFVDTLGGASAEPSAGESLAWEDIAHLLCSCGKDHCDAVNHADGVSPERYARDSGCESKEIYEVAERIAKYVNDLAQSQAASAEPSASVRDAVRAAISDALGDAMDCTRVWSAWGVGTMSQDDFTRVNDDDARLDEIVDATLSATLSPLMQAAAPTIDETPSCGQENDYRRAQAAGKTATNVVCNACNYVGPLKNDNYDPLEGRSPVLEEATAGKAAPQTSAESVTDHREKIAKIFAYIWHGDIDEWKGFLSKADAFLAYPNSARTPPQPSRIDAAAEPTREEIARQTVETIPRDGRRLILFWDDSDDIPTHFELGWWRDGSWRNTYGHPFSGEPTHWFDPLALSKPRGEPAREGGEDVANGSRHQCATPSAPDASAPAQRPRE